MNLLDLTKAGIHFLTEPLRLASGTQLKAEAGSRLVGGVRLQAEPLGNGQWFCDLKRAGIAPSPLISRGFARKIIPAHNELFINGKPMRIAQYPKNGFLEITAVGETAPNDWDLPSGTLEGGFFYQDDRPKQWKRGSLWVFGYWAWDWAPTREQVAELDAERGFIRCCPPYGHDCYTIGQRFHFFNVLDEVTEPGDYAIDYENGTLTFIPPADTDPETAEVLLSLNDRPAFLIEDAEDIQIEGFRIECFRGDGIRVSRAKNVRIAGCELCNIGNRGISVDDSVDTVISGCELHDTGDAGVAIFAGDRKTLTPGCCGVENCRIHHVARWDRCYEPPIRLSGVGLFARGNRIHDCPHTAILYNGNDICISGNEIYRVVLETSDAGAIYAGRDYTMRGNVIENNFIHHIGNRLKFGVMGIYNDDCLSGVVMRNNVFYRVQSAILLGGGVDYVCEGNVFIACKPAISCDGRGQSDHPIWRSMVSETLRERFYHIEDSDVSAAEPPYLTRYPELAKLDALYRSSDAPLIPPTARIKDNVFVIDEAVHEEQRVQLTMAAEGAVLTMEGNRDAQLPELTLTDRQKAVIFGRAED